MIARFAAHRSTLSGAACRTRSRASTGKSCPPIENVRVCGEAQAKVSPPSAEVIWEMTSSGPRIRELPCWVR